MSTLAWLAIANVAGLVRSEAACWTYRVLDCCLRVFVLCLLGCLVLRRTSQNGWNPLTCDLSHLNSV